MLLLRRTLILLISIPILGYATQFAITYGSQAYELIFWTMISVGCIALLLRIAFANDDELLAPDAVSRLLPRPNNHKSVANSWFGMFWLFSASALSIAVRVFIGADDIRNTGVVFAFVGIIGLSIVSMSVGLVLYVWSMLGALKR